MGQDSLSASDVRLGPASYLLVRIPNLTHEEAAEVTEHLQALGRSGGVGSAEGWDQTHQLLALDIDDAGADNWPARVLAFVQQSKERGDIGPHVEARVVMHTLFAGQVIRFAVVFEASFVNKIFCFWIFTRTEQIKNPV